MSFGKSIEFPFFDPLMRVPNDEHKRDGRTFIKLDGGQRPLSYVTEKSRRKSMRALCMYILLCRLNQSGCMKSIV